MARTFTLEEARTLLPVLGALLRRAQESAVRASECESELRELSQRIFLAGGMHVDVAAAARQKAGRDKALAIARSAIEEIEAVGVRVGESNDGRLEFPSVLGAREVLLCWTLGEGDEIRHWREDAEGAPLQNLTPEQPDPDLLH